jgi:glycosyltransferase involved in cell wall biosynthesis
MNILFLSRWFPYPPGNGSKLRIYNLLRGLAGQHHVTLLSFADEPVSAADVQAMQQICGAVQVVPWQGFNPESPRARLGFFSITPRSVIDTFSPEMDQRIRQTLADNPIDLVIASQIDMAAYADSFHGYPALFEEAEVGVLYDQFHQAASWQSWARHGLTWTKHRRYLNRLMQSFVGSTVASEQEQQLLQQVLSNTPAVSVTPNCINLPDYTAVNEPEQADTLIYTGAFSYFANHQAMVWFVGQVYPRIKAEIPAARLVITGNHADRPLPSAPDVTLTGFVDDVRPYIASAAISLAPIWHGGGTRLKILEAMALRTPVVATSKGAEGLAVTPEEHLLIADTPADFSAAVVRLLQDKSLRERLAENAFQLVSQKYDWAAMMPQFLNLVQNCASGNGHHDD